jgi:hypothetical protein
MIYTFANGEEVFVPDADCKRIYGYYQNISAYGIAKIFQVEQSGRK